MTNHTTFLHEVSRPIYTLIFDHLVHKTWPITVILPIKIDQNFIIVHELEQIALVFRLHSIQLIA